MAKKRSIWHTIAKYSFTFSEMNKSYVKTCKVCPSILIKKDGFKRWKQRYKCKDCGHVFQNKSRNTSSKQDIISELWKKYSCGKQTYKQLSETYGFSVSKIQSLLDSYEFIAPHVRPTKIVLLMDTTYFWDIGDGI